MSLDKYIAKISEDLKPGHELSNTLYQDTKDYLAAWQKENGDFKNEDKLKAFEDLNSQMLNTLGFGHFSLYETERLMLAPGEIPQKHTPLRDEFDQAQSTHDFLDDQKIPLAEALLIAARSGNSDDLLSLANLYKGDMIQFRELVDAFNNDPKFKTFGVTAYLDYGYGPTTLNVMGKKDTPHQNYIVSILFPDSGDAPQELLVQKIPR